MVPRRIVYARAVLVRGGFHKGDAQVRALIAIMVGEGSQAHWNPMDTTVGAPGATPYNSFGPNGEYHVWNYPNAQTGVAITIQTLKQENMSVLANALRNEKATAQEILEAFAETEWAFKGDDNPLDISEAWAKGTRRYEEDWAVVVAGPGVWPYGAEG